jgi:hypothetical protein
MSVNGPTGLGIRVGGSQQSSIPLSKTELLPGHIVLQSGITQKRYAGAVACMSRDRQAASCFIDVGGVTPAKGDPSCAAMYHREDWTLAAGKATAAVLLAVVKNLQGSYWNDRWR